MKKKINKKRLLCINYERAKGFKLYRIVLGLDIIIQNVFGNKMLLLYSK
jgi:hypothetical protein